MLVIEVGTARSRLIAVVQSTSNAGWVQTASVQDFKPFCKFLAKFSAKLPGGCSQLNLVIQSIARQQSRSPA
ncbi:MAG: hypothetical protein EAZ09_21285 [Oscillatoriales cyanobacterium]|nr:MAG: hypothetical protein EAZ18_18005 [Oscillatoriales cyanobacterium]TAH16530.1 MAG: hypothetical protein EAZ09_21285 [Oscillatoriales cyanobacterium]